MTKSYNIKGELFEETPFENGSINDTIKRYKKGKIQNEVPFIDGHNTGTFKEYDENGKVLREIEYLDGTRKQTKIN